MSLDGLTRDEKRIVHECLVAASEGPFFPDWEFETLFGLQRDQVRRIAASGPDVDDSREDVRIAISGAMGNLLGYPHGQEAAWSRFISVPEAEVERVLDKWRSD